MLPVRQIRLLLVLVTAMGLSSCMVYGPPRSSVYVQSGPGPGVMGYDYWYYPDAQVYFDINRRIYFYYSNSRWIETRVLPPLWRDRLHGYVRIQSRHQRPYLEYNEHLRKFPPRSRPRQEYDIRRDHRYNEERYDQRDKSPRYYQEQPRKEPPGIYRDERIERAPARPDSRVKVPARERYEDMLRRQKEEKAREQSKDKKNNRYKKKSDKDDRKSRDKDQHGDDKGNRYRKDDDGQN